MTSVGGALKLRKNAASIEPGATVDDFSRFLGNPNFVLSLARGLAVMEVFEDDTEGLSVGEVAARTKLSRAAVRRIFLTLEMLGYAEPGGRGYRLKTRVMRLAASFVSSNALAAMAHELTDKITEQVQESSSVSVLDRDEVLFLARSTAKRLMSTRITVGSRLPAYCTSMGRILLAGLSERDLEAYFKRVKLEALTPKTVTKKSALMEIIRRVQTTGYALVDDELEMGLRSIAVPVRGAGGQTVAAMNIGVQASRVSIKDMVQQFLPILNRHARTLGRITG
jgi:IclR family pca regulon transcriptional regulator